MLRTGTPRTHPPPQITYLPNSLVGKPFSNMISNSSYVHPFISGTLYQHQIKHDTLSPPKKKPNLPFRFASSGLMRYGIATVMMMPTMA
jgi:hypothetical protein